MGQVREPLIDDWSTRRATKERTSKVDEVAGSAGVGVLGLINESAVWVCVCVVFLPIPGTLEYNVNTKLRTCSHETGWVIKVGLSFM